MNICPISAADSSNGLNGTSVSSDDVLQNSIDDNLTSIPDEVLSSKNIAVEVGNETPNQILNPTIQNAIDCANSGDTIVLNGNFAHCHFIINKTLNIIGTPGTTLGPCPHYQSEGLGDFGVFYITEGGSGSVFKGITFLNTARAQTPFSFLIRNASDITISNCTENYNELDEFKFQGITIENSKNIELSNLIINNTLFGVKITNSSMINILDDVISNNVNQGISITDDSKNINIKRNSIENNKNKGISLESADNISVLNNLIRDNGLNDKDTGSGIYVNTNITKLIVKGNIFINNGLHAIMYDYRCRNLNKEAGADKLTDIDNNYFEGHTSMVLHHRTYVERDHGEFKYDAENDVYGSVGEGKYAEAKSYVYMKNAFIFRDVPCGYTYYTTSIPWTLQAPANGGKYDFSLKLNLKQIKNGLYQVSIIDSKGNIAKDFNSIDILVFLNDYSTVQPQAEDIYKKVTIKNGVGTADFRSNYQSFKTTGNIITAVFPGMSEKVSNSAHVQLSIKDSSVPINPTTKLTASKITTYPLSNKYLSVKLVNSKGKGISGAKISFTFNGKSYTAKTNSKGIAKVKVSLSKKKTYKVTLRYLGSDDYKPSKATTKIIIKTGSKKSKITASNIKIKRNKKKTFSLKLTSSAKKPLKNQKVIVKLNGKTYTIKTNSKGIAKLSIKLSKVKKYKISMNFLGNAKYKATSKSNTIRIFK